MVQTALLVRCSEEEAQLIRDAAKREHRSVSAYITNAAMSRIKHRQDLLEEPPEDSDRQGQPAQLTSIQVQKLK